MSDLPAYRRAARSQPCPHCEAAAGQPCRAPSGRTTYEHSTRYAITRLAQNIGYEEGLRDALALMDWKAREYGVNATVAQAREPVERQLEMAARGVARDEAALVIPPAPRAGGES